MCLVTSDFVPLSTAIPQRGALPRTFTNWTVGTFKQQGCFGWLRSCFFGSQLCLLGGTPNLKLVQLPPFAWKTQVVCSCISQYLGCGCSVLYVTFIDHSQTRKLLGNKHLQPLSIFYRMLTITSNTFGRVEHKNSNPIILGLQMPTWRHPILMLDLPNIKVCLSKWCSQADALTYWQLWTA